MGDPVSRCAAAPGPDKAAGSALARRSLFTTAAAAAARPLGGRSAERKKATTQVGRQVREPEAKAGALKFWA